MRHLFILSQLLYLHKANVEHVAPRPQHNVVSQSLMSLVSLSNSPNEAHDMEPTVSISLSPSPPIRPEIHMLIRLSRFSHSPDVSFTLTRRSLNTEQPIISKNAAALVTIQRHARTCSCQSACCRARRVNVRAVVDVHPRPSRVTR